MRLKIIESNITVGYDWLYKLYKLIDSTENLYHVLTASGFMNKHYLDILYDSVIIEATVEQVYGRNIVTSIEKVDFNSKDWDNVTKGQ